MRACMRKISVENQLSGYLHLTTLLLPSPYVGSYLASVDMDLWHKLTFIPPWIQGVWCPLVAWTACTRSSSKQTPFGSTLPALLPQTTAPVSCRECLPSIHRIMFSTCFNLYPIMWMTSSRGTLLNCLLRLCSHCTYPTLVLHILRKDHMMLLKSRLINAERI